MAATLNDMSYDILKLHGKYHIGNANFNDLQEVIKRSILSHYALYVRRDVDRNGGSDEYYRTIGVELEKVSKTDIVCKPVGCTVLRSKNKIPQTVRLKTNEFKFIGTIDRLITFTRTREEELKYTYANDFTSAIPRYILKNEYLYVYNWSRVKTISIEDIFLTSTDDGICTLPECIHDDGNIELPMPEDILLIIRTEVLKELINA